MPQKPMAFVGHSQMYPDDSYSSFQMALPLGNVKTPVLSPLPQSVSAERSQPPYPVLQTQYSLAFHFEPMLPAGEVMIQPSWYSEVLKTNR